MSDSRASEREDRKLEQLRAALNAGIDELNRGDYLEQ